MSNWDQDLKPKMSRIDRIHPIQLVSLLVYWIRTSYPDPICTLTSLISFSSLLASAKSPSRINCAVADCSSFNVPHRSESTSAKLRIYATSAQTVGFDVHSVSDDTWTETGITYSNALAVDSTIVGSSGAVTANTWR
jgi:hypothetical protein